MTSLPQPHPQDHLPWARGWSLPLTLTAKKVHEDNIFGRQDTLQFFCEISMQRLQICKISKGQIGTLLLLLVYIYLLAVKRLRSLLDKRVHRTQQHFLSVRYFVREILNVRTPNPKESLVFLKTNKFKKKYVPL